MNTYSIIVNKLRDFLDKLNFIETRAQNKLSLLTIADEPKLMCTFNYGGYVWPLPQSNLLLLQLELLTYPSLSGIYNICTSYKNNPDYTRFYNNICETDIVSPLFEFVMFGRYIDVKNIVLNILEELNFGPKSTYIITSYDVVAKRYGSKELTVEKELNILSDSNVFILEYIPKPVWNVKKIGNTQYLSKIIIDNLEVATFMEYSTNSN